MRYGLAHDIQTFNPVRIAFHKWARMLRETVRARSLRDAFVRLFGPLELQPGQVPEKFSTNSA